MSSTVDTQEATAAAGGEEEAVVSNLTGSLRILNRGTSLLDGSNGSQSSDAAATDCLEVSFRDEQQQQALPPGQVFEALNEIGDVRWIDFSNFHLNRTIVVAYFDLRAAQRAYTRLNEAELSASAEYVHLPESQEDRKVVLSVTSTDSFDTIREELTQFGDLHRMSFQDSSIVAEFYDTRARASIQASLGAPGFKQLGPAIGPALRAPSASLIGSGKDRINLHAPGSSSGSCSGAQRAAMMGYQQPRVITTEGRGASVTTGMYPDQISCGSESVTSGRYPKTTAVPNSQFVIDLDRVASGADPRTTCMIRNIPNKYTQKMLLKLFDSVPTICGQYDFFYLPMDFRNKCNVGYAFIDFANPRTSIPALVRAFDGKKWERFNSEKICKITFARLQGSKQLMDHFKTSSVMQQSNKQIRPWFQRDQSGMGQYPPRNNSPGEHARHHHQLPQPPMNLDGFKGPMAAANSEPAALDYNIPLADLCAIGEPSLLANALAELQRNQEGSSSVILENFPLENWSDGASSIGGLSAPATYYSEPAHPPASMPTLAGYSQLDFSSLPGWADDRNQSLSVSNAPMAAADTWQRAQSSDPPPPPPPAGR